MRLRLRLALAVIAASLPLAAATVWLRYDLERRQVEQVLREFAVARMESGGRERCEAEPETFPGPRRADLGRQVGPGSRPPPPPPPPGVEPPGDSSGGTPPPPPPESGGRRPPPGEGSRRRPPPPPPPPDGTRTEFWAYDVDLASSNPAAPPVPEDLAAAARAGEAVASARFAAGGRQGHQALVRMAWDEGPCVYLLVRRVSPGAGDAVDPWLAGGVVAAGVLLAVLLSMGPVVRRIRRLEAEVRGTAGQAYMGAVHVGVDVDGGDEITALAVAFNDAAAQVREHVDELREREEILRRFVADTTHDLMTPLTVLQGHLAGLRDAVGDGAGSAAEAARHALREVDYTTSLVANLGTAAKLEGDPAAVVLHPVDLSALVGRVTARFAPVAAAAGVTLDRATPESAPVFRGDVTLLEQAVGNVVQNAVRYNRPGGHVTVILRSDDGVFHLQVVDDGPGIPAGELERLNRRGGRGDAARSRAPGGAGLGLDITRRVCERLGIDLDLTQTGSGAGGLAVNLRGRLEDA